MGRFRPRATPSSCREGAEHADELPEAPDYDTRPSEGRGYCVRRPGWWLEGPNAPQWEVGS